MTLGEKIQKLRKQRGLSQEALAEKVTVTRQTISKWELGQSTPDLDFIAQLSDIFNVSSDYLIKDEMTEPDELPYKKRNYRLSERGKRIILVIVSAAALIAGRLRQKLRRRKRRSPRRRRKLSARKKRSGWQPRRTLRSKRQRMQTKQSRRSPPAGHSPQPAQQQKGPVSNEYS